MLKREYVRKEDRVQMILETARKMENPSIKKVAIALRISTRTVSTHFPNNEVLKSAL